MDNITDKMDKKANSAYIISIVSIILIVLLLLAIGGIVIYLALRKKKDLLYLGNDTSQSTLNSSTDFVKLYTYYTQARELKLQKYQGQFEITLSSSSGIDFKVTDENNNDITGKITKGNNNLPTIVEFNTQKEVSEINLYYKGTSTPSLLRLEIEI
jgi:flagellar basal body-associated protein FliL